MKKLVLAAVSAVAMVAAAAPAAAVTYTFDLGTITVPPTRSFFPGFDIATGTVDAYVTFTLASEFAMESASFTSSEPAVNFTSAGIYAGTLTSAPAAGSAIAINTTQTPNGTSNTISVPTRMLEAGSYTFYVNGNASADTSLGSSITFRAVPEPATWGLMLLGFGMVGMGLRSRRSARVTFA